VKREQAARRHVPRQPVWCVVANVVRERPFGPGGAETRHGTKHFRGGAKVHIVDAYWGMCTHVVVIGQRRSSMKWTRVAMSVAHLENFRAKLVYGPQVVDGAIMFNGGRQDCWDRDDVQRACSAFGVWKKETARSGPTSLTSPSIAPSTPAPSPEPNASTFPDLLAQKLRAIDADSWALVDVKLPGGIVVERVVVRDGRFFLSNLGGEREAPFDPRDVVDVRIASWRPSWWWPQAE
jgi:hypothetical protein